MQTIAPVSSQGVVPAGAMLGRFELVGLLSVGGMAEIYLARTAGIAGFEKLVVVKRMLPHLAQQPDFVEMFLAEARLGAMLDHPNCVQVHDIGEDTGNYYYAMDYVRGPDLRRIMKAAQGPLPASCAITIGIGLCAGLAHAHDLTDLQGRPLGVVHRDVTLSNVLVSYDGCVKVTDFGVAKVTANDTHTRTGTLKGKIGYMSPEQCRGEPLDRRSDLFAAGIILYELTTGRRLFKPRQNELEILQRIVHDTISPPSLIDPDYPLPLEDIVMRALTRDRESRYQTARDMQRDLEALVHSGRFAATPHELGEYVRTVVPPTPIVLDPAKPTLVTEPVELDLWEVEEPPPPGAPRAATVPEVSTRIPRQWNRLAVALLAVLVVAIAIVVLLQPDREDRPPEVTTAATPPRAPEPPPPRVEPIRAEVEVPAAKPRDERPRDEVAVEPVQRTREPDHARDHDRERKRKAPPPPPPAKVRTTAASIETLERDAAPAGPPPDALYEEDLVEPDARPKAEPTPAPEPEQKPEPPKKEPPKKEPPKKEKAVKADPGTFDAVPSLTSIEVSGPLADSEIRRAVNRVMSDFRDCYQDAARNAGRTPAARVTLTFSVDETRSARKVDASGSRLSGLDACLESAAARIRTRIAPDVGDARVTVGVSFRPTEP